MDSFYQILEYLPLEYKISSDFIYFQKLLGSTERNLDAKDYHIALVTLHMIYMGVVYHYIYQLFRSSPKKFDSILIGFHHILKLKNNENISWHVFSKIYESSIFEFYRSLGLKQDVIGGLKSPVNNRNDILHTNGVYIDSESVFNERAQNYLNCLKKIDSACYENYCKLYKKFLRSVSVSLPDKEEANGYFIDDFIREYGVSRIACNNLLKLKKIEYPGSRNNTRLFYLVLEDIGIA